MINRNSWTFSGHRRLYREIVMERVLNKKLLDKKQ
jgi:hypothetical protein